MRGAKETMHPQLKNLALAAAASLIFTATAARADTYDAARAASADAAPQNLIDVNPFSLIIGELSFEYERALTPYASLVLGPKAILFQGVGGTDGLTVYGAGIDLSVHFFPMGNALHGFWLGPQLSLEYEHASYGDAAGSGVGVGGFGVVGYTFFPGEHVPISLGLGAGYASAGATATDSQGVSASASKSGFALTGRIAIGYAW